MERSVSYFVNKKKKKKGVGVRDIYTPIFDGSCRRFCFCFFVFTFED